MILPALLLLTFLIHYLIKTITDYLHLVLLTASQLKQTVKRDPLLTAVLRMPVTFVRRYHILASSGHLTSRSHLVFFELSLESITALQRLITIFLEPTEEDVHMWGHRLGLDPGDIHDVIIFERKCARLVQNIVIVLVTLLIWLAALLRCSVFLSHL